MARIVFILGAGASQSAGAPLMREFMARIRDLRDGSLPEVHRAAFDLVWRAFLELKPVHANVKMDYQGNIEDLFATFEMARILGQLGTLSGEEIGRLPDAMREVIATTIELGMAFPVAEDGWVHPHPTYDAFARMIKAHKDNRSRSFAVITFNYDIALDYALAAWDVPYDYCLEGHHEGQIPYLKLHGSLNWRGEPGGGEIRAIPVRVQRLDGVGVKKVLVRASEWKANGAEPASRLPFIVPPTWNKTQYHQSIDAVWSRAAHELEDAVTVFVIGYSAPRTDEFFRHLFALGLARGGVIDRIWIINTNSEAHLRIRGMVAGSLERVTDLISGDFHGQLERIAALVGLEGDALARWREGKV